MSATRCHLPTLSLLPSLGQPTDSAVPLERQISPHVLLDIAPDREALLLSGKPIEEIRAILKLHVNENYGHWLSMTKRRQGARYRDRTARASKFLDQAPFLSGDENASPKEEEDIQIVRRVCSAGALGSFMNGIDSRLNINVSTGGAITFDVWGDPRLSSTEKVISPRVLGSTHILVIHEGELSPKKTLSKSKDSRRDTIPYSLELPINDLLFVLNVPNLAPPSRSLNEVSARILPHRLHKELPRVLMAVPHLDTFPELVVYLHTKNQAALFRKIIPEWIRDLMHPLPLVAVPLSSPFGTRGDAGSIAYSATESYWSHRRKRSFFSGMFSPTALEFPESGNSSHESLVPLTLTAPFNGSCTSLVDTDRTVLSISKEIAEVAASTYDDNDVLIRTTARLDDLRDNLEYIGYFGKSLWGELVIHRDILVRAIAHKSKLDASSSDSDSSTL
ncbi:hypothetical protein ONZ45_g9579 [Pleurotus djamor]|nr:hypothetical protein ONZ45_g9579 [Pleurotus djamor]